MPKVNCIYIAASSLDARYTRICVASIRLFYPQIPIRLLVGGRLQGGLSDELRKYWDVRIAELPATGDYGWGFVKLEPLFGSQGERFLILDSDTVLTGPVLDLWRNSEALFLVDEETQSEGEINGIYYDWRKLLELDPYVQAPGFLFNTGQWFGTSGVLTRDDFSPWLVWTMPRSTTPPDYFKNGEQGILNYVLNRKAIREALPVERKKIMCWPGRSMEGIDVESICKRAAPLRVVHWAGLKKARLREMAGGNLLAYFEDVYYERLPIRDVRRIAANCQDRATNYIDHMRISIRLAFNRYRQRVAS